MHGGTCKIGLLGGIGPGATAEFYKRLILELQRSGFVLRNEDFPQIVINSIPAPELIRATVSKTELAPYMEGLKTLDSLRPDFIVMVCNTVHLFYPQLQAGIRAPILDLRKSVKTTLLASGYRRVTVLGTRLTAARRMYCVRGVTYMRLKNKEEELLEQAVFDYNRGYMKKEQRRKVREIAERCISDGAQAVVAGCTEVSLMLEESGIRRIDTLDVLVDATVSRIADLRGR